MKVAIIFLDYFRHEHTKQALRSVSNAGYPFDLFTIQEKGIAKAINKGINLTKEYDAVVTCANDIEMPDNWLFEMVKYSKAINNTGMCGIHCVESINTLIEINGLSVHPTFTAFGNVLIPRKVIDKVGYFNEDYDPYGRQDADFAYRLNKLGYINYYIPNMQSNHIGHDVGNGTEYRKMKDEGLSLSEEKWNYWCNYYDTTQDYTIFQKQMI
jgi:GT2 family glycosyltransferase